VNTIWQETILSKAENTWCSKDNSWYRTLRI